MTSEVKLLTVQMAEALGAMSPEARVRMLRERGLIAPEPVDPLLEEAEALHKDWIARKHKDAIAMLIAALRRGMELRPQITREALGDAIVKVFNEGAKGFGGVTPDNITRLHAALTDGGRDG